MPLALNDDEMNAVQAAAAPIHPLQRDAFLKALAAELEKHTVIGPGGCASLRGGAAGPIRRRGARGNVALGRAASQGAPGGPLSRQIGKLQVRLRQHLRTKRGQRGKLGATPSAAGGISTSAKARSCSPSPIRSRTKADGAY
jgi:hypothetical protein